MHRNYLKPGRFVDPLTDFGFKLFFGSEPNKDILIAFLNELFKGQKVITDLVYNSTEQPGDNNAEKKVFFDLLCTGQNGEQFIIEMQRAAQRNFKDRVVFYTSRRISNQLPTGTLNWNVELKEVYLIAILEFDFQTNTDRYLHNVSLTNTDTGETFYNKLGYKFLELSKFVKTDAEIETDLDRWFYLLKHMYHLDKIPAILNKRIFQKLFKIAEVSKLTKEERAMYDSNLKARWDYENSIAFAGEQEFERGRHTEALDIALEMLKDGFSVAQVAKLTKLSVEEIQKLKSSIA
jgi:predicted transposase/invertase (TIGR01784 family)